MGQKSGDNVVIPIQVDSNGYLLVDMSNIALDDLSDVNVGNPPDAADDGKVLYWDNTEGEFKLKTINITTGTYAGNGSSYKDVSLDFTPKLVIVNNRAVLKATLILSYTSGGYAMFLEEGQLPTDGDADDKIITNGFRVDNHMNQSSNTYDYVAIG